MNHNVPSRRYLQAMQPKHFANAPPNTISNYGAAQCFFYADAEAAAPGIVGAVENNELRTRTPASATVSQIKIAAAQQAGFPAPYKHSFIWSARLAAGFRSEAAGLRSA